MKTTSEVHARKGLDSVEQRMGSVEGGVPYYIYRLLSGLTHPGLNTSRIYAPVTEDGGHFLNRPEKPTREAIADAPVLDVAMRVVGASLIFQREVNDPDLETRMTRWCGDMGLTGELPKLTPLKSSPETRQDVKNSAGTVLETELEPLRDVLESLAADGLPGDVDPSTAAKALRRLEGAAQKLTALCGEAN